MKNRSKGSTTGRTGNRSRRVASGASASRAAVAKEQQTLRRTARRAKHRKAQ